MGFWRLGWSILYYNEIQTFFVAFLSFIVTPTLSAYLFLPFFALFVRKWWFVLIWLASSLILMSYIAQGKKYRTPSCPTSLQGRIAVVTGTSKGSIGHSIALELAQLGATVFICQKSYSKAERSAALIAQISGADPRKIVPVCVDLGDLASVKKGAEEILSQTNQIHMLCNNAAILTRAFSQTRDGLESQFGVNHIGHFFFTQMLLETLLATNYSRVVNLSSVQHVSFTGKFDFSRSKANWSSTQDYAMSKLANIYHAKELQRRYGNDRTFAAYSVHPGISLTNLGREYGVSTQFLDHFGPFLSWIFKTPRQGSQTPLYCLLAPEAIPGGFHVNCTKHESWISDMSQPASELWTLSENFISQLYPDLKHLFDTSKKVQ